MIVGLWIAVGALLLIAAILAATVGLLAGELEAERRLSKHYKEAYEACRDQRDLQVARVERAREALK